MPEVNLNIDPTNYKVVSGKTWSITGLRVDNNFSSRCIFNDSTTESASGYYSSELGDNVSTGVYSTSGQFDNPDLRVSWNLIHPRGNQILGTEALRDPFFKSYEINIRNVDGTFKSGINFINNGSITAVDLISGGSGYVNPTVFVSGDGTGAAIEVKTLGTGTFSALSGFSNIGFSGYATGIHSVNVVSGGSGYTAANTKLVVSGEGNDAHTIGDMALPVQGGDGVTTVGSGALVEVAATGFGIREGYYLQNYIDIPYDLNKDIFGGEGQRKFMVEVITNDFYDHTSTGRIIVDFPEPEFESVNIVDTKRGLSFGVTPKTGQVFENKIFEDASLEKIEIHKSNTADFLVNTGDVFTSTLFHTFRPDNKNGEGKLSSLSEIDVPSEKFVEQDFFSGYFYKLVPYDKFGTGQILDIGTGIRIEKNIDPVDIPSGFRLITDQDKTVGTNIQGEVVTNTYLSWKKDIKFNTNQYEVTIEDDVEKDSYSVTLNPPQISGIDFFISGTGANRADFDEKSAMQVGPEGMANDAFDIFSPYSTDGIQWIDHTVFLDSEYLETVSDSISNVEFVEVPAGNISSGYLYFTGLDGKHINYAGSNSFSLSTDNEEPHALVARNVNNEVIVEYEPRIKIPTKKDGSYNFKVRGINKLGEKSNYSNIVNFTASGAASHFDFDPLDTSLKLGGTGTISKSGPFVTTVGGSGISAAGTGVVAVGGVNNTVTGEFSALVGGSGNQLLGGIGNPAESSFLGGGRGNYVSGNRNALVGGHFNLVSGDGQSLLGGANNILFGSNQDRTSGENQIGNEEAFGFENSTIVGGQINTVSGQINFIGGGDRNVIGLQLNRAATINGGPIEATDIDTIKKISSVGVKGSAIAGGTQNQIFGNYNFIGGGLNNRIFEGSNSQKGAYSVIIGGQDNTITGTATQGTSIIGGKDNVGAGANAIIGGLQSTGEGAYSLAIGSYGWANHEGSFVLADGTQPTKVEGHRGHKKSLSTHSLNLFFENGTYVRNGDLYVSGDATISGNLNVSGSFTLGDATTDTLTAIGEITTNDYISGTSGYFGKVGIGYSDNFHPDARLVVGQNPNNGFAIIAGSDNGGVAPQISNSQTKVVRIGMPHYTITEEPVTLITATSSSSKTDIHIGGGTAYGNAAENIYLRTAASTTTTKGTTALYINNEGQVLAGADAGLTTAEGLGATFTVSGDASITGELRTDGSVGIGVAPSNKLHVEGSASSAYMAYIKNTHSSAGYGLLIDAGDDNNVSALAVRDKDGTARMIVRGGGNVGIGTGSPSERLHIGAVGADVTRSLRIDGTNGSSETAGFIIKNDGENGRVEFQHNVGNGTPVPRMKLDNFGNLLIGDGVGSTQGAKLLVSGDASITGYLNVNENITVSANVLANNFYPADHIYHQGDTDTYIQFSSDRIQLYGGSVELIDAREAGADYVAIGGVGDNPDVNFLVGSAVNGIDYVLEVDAGTSTVGINCDPLDAKGSALVVSGDASITGELKAGGPIIATSTSRVQADVLNNGANSANIIYRTDRTIVGNNASALVVLDGGNVGIGNTGPSFKLQVNGDVRINSGDTFLDDGQSIRWGGTDAKIDGSSGGDYLRFYTNGSVVSKFGVNEFGFGTGTVNSNYSFRVVNKDYGIFSINTSTSDRPSFVAHHPRLAGTRAQVLTYFDQNGGTLGGGATTWSIYANNVNDGAATADFAINTRANSFSDAFIVTNAGNVFVENNLQVSGDLSAVTSGIVADEGGYVSGTSGYFGKVGIGTTLIPSDTRLHVQDTTSNSTATKIRVQGGSLGFTLGKAQTADHYAHLRPVADNAMALRVMPNGTTTRESYVEVWNKDYETAANSSSWHRGMFYIDTSSDVYLRADGYGTAGSVYIGTENNTQTLAVKDDGKVGIGTTDPISPLTVSGDTTNGQFLTTIANAGTQSEDNGLLIDVGTAGASANAIKVKTGGSANAFIINGEGKAGLGLTASNMDALFTVNGDASITGELKVGTDAQIGTSVSTSKLAVNTAVDATLTVQSHDNNENVFALMTDHAKQLFNVRQSADAALLRVYKTDGASSQTQTIALDADSVSYITGGNLAVGTTTSDNALSIVMPAADSSNLFNSSISDTNAALSVFKAFNNGSDDSDVEIGKFGVARAGFGASTDWAGHFKFYTHGGVTTPSFGSERFRLTWDGNGRGYFGVTSAKTVGIYAGDNKVQITSDGTQHTAPQATLVVSGDASITGVLNTALHIRLGTTSNNIGNATNPIITPKSDATAGIYFKGGGVGLGAGADSKSLLLTDAGIVGIGTQNPVAKLEVNAGNVRVDDDRYVEWGGTNARIGGSNAGDYVFFLTNNEDRMRIISNGNVGIGENAPTGKLHIYQSGDSQPAFLVEGSQGSLFSVEDTLTGSLMSVNDIAGLPVFEAFDDGTIVMGQYNSGDLVVTGNKVGIGTSAPTSSIQVKGNQGTTFEFTDSSNRSLTDLGAGVLSWNAAAVLGSASWGGTADIEIDQVASSTRDILNVGDKFDVSPIKNQIRLRDHAYVSGNLYVSGSVVTADGTSPDHISGLSGYFGKAGIGSSTIDAGVILQVTKTDVGDNEVPEVIKLSTLNSASPSWSMTDGLCIGAQMKKANGTTISKQPIKFRYDGGDMATTLEEGKVGIGTTSPSEELEIYSTASAPVSAIIETNQDQEASLKLKNSQGEWEIKADNGADAFRIADVGTASRFSIEKGGQVGIGGTGQLGAQLTVHGDTSITGELRVDAQGSRGAWIVADNGNQLYLDNDGDQWTQINFANNGTNRTFLALDYTNHNFVLGAQGAYSSLDRISFRPDGTNDDMVIKRDGKVGIGTTDPSEKLEIYGNGAALRFEAASTDQDPSAVIKFAENSTTDNHFRIEYDGSSAHDANGALIFGGYGATATDEFAMISREGQMMVGNFHQGINGRPQATFTVSGDASITGELKVNGEVHIPSNLVHKGDTDTYLNFNADRIRLNAGGVELIDAREAGADYVAIGGVGDNPDVNFLVGSAVNGIDYVLEVDAGSSTVGINCDPLDAQGAALVVSGDASITGELKIGDSSFVKGNFSLHGVNSPYLHIDGLVDAYARIDRGASNRQAYIAFQTAGSENWVVGVPDSDNWTSSNGGEFYIGQNTDADNVAPALVIDETSNYVGIGDFRTAMPQAMLTVSGDASITGELKTDGNVGINADPVAHSQTAARNLVIKQDSGGGGITISTATNAGGNIYFSDGTIGDQLYRGYLVYNHTIDTMLIGAAGNTHFAIDATATQVTGQLRVNDEVKISDTAEVSLSVYSSHAIGSQIRLDATATGGDEWRIVSAADSAGIGGGAFGLFNVDAGEYKFAIDATATQVTGDLRVTRFIKHGGDEGTKIDFGSTEIDLFANNIKGISVKTTEVAINDNSADVNFRVESDNSENMIFVDAGNDLVGFGTPSPSPSYTVTVSGGLAADYKSFIIDHPDPAKPDKQLAYASSETPEHNVFVRGKAQSKIIELPDHWPYLVHEDSIGVQLTPIGEHQELYVESIKDNKILINNNKENKINCFYLVHAERKDIGKLEIEPDKSVNKDKENGE